MLKIVVRFLPVFFIFVEGNKVQQTHLSWHGDPTKMVVTWLTQHKLPADAYPFVRYGLEPSSLNISSDGKTTAWTDAGKKKKVRYTHRAIMEGLRPGQRYYYEVGSSEEISQIFYFNVMDLSKAPRVAIFGDLATKEGKIYNQLNQSVHRNEVDMIIHIGDLAYAMDDNDGDNGDDFMNLIEPFASIVPYMVISGNHEVTDNFNHLRNRFTMPPNGIVDDNNFWSITLGGAHFVGLSTEYYAENLTALAQQQYQWLINDFKKDASPWRFIFMHRMMYCSNKKARGCEDYENTMTRDGAPGLPALEPIFRQAGVDMGFWGHKHTYQRSYPIFEDIGYPQPDAYSYKNAPATVYIQSGAAGCHSHTDPDEEIQQSYTAVMLGEYGFNVLEVLSPTLVNTYYVNAVDGARLDQFELTKNLGYRPNGSQ